MLYLWLIVELAADAVADEIAHHRAALALGELLNRGAQVPEARAGHANTMPSASDFSRHFDDFFASALGSPI